MQHPTIGHDEAKPPVTFREMRTASCTASDAWSGSKAISGNQSTGVLSASSSYTLTCTGAGGSTSRSAAVTVTPGTPAPTVTLNANPGADAAGFIEANK